METLTIEEMMRMQARLQEKYKDKWRPVTPENAYYSLLWAVGEAGEVIDILKKQGHEAVISDAGVRTHFMEETVDVFMYLWDMLLCAGISPEELSRVYRRKHAFNMKRTYGAEHFSEEETDE